MGEAKRRKKSPSRSLDALTEAYTEMHAQGGGVWELEVISQVRLLEMILMPDQRNLALVRCLPRMFQQIHAYGETDKPVLCLLCPEEIRSESNIAAFVILSPRVPAPTQVGFHCICPECFNSGNVLDRAFAVFKEQLIHDARRITEHPDWGHA